MLYNRTLLIIYFVYSVQFSHSFSYLEPVCCSMSSSNCCFLTCIQISQEAGQVVWYSHLYKNFPQFTVSHTVKGFGIVNKAEVDVFLELSCFSVIQWMLAIWSLVPLPFLKPAWTSGSSRFTYYWSLAWRILSITLLACEMRAIVLENSAVATGLEKVSFHSNPKERLCQRMLKLFSNLELTNVFFLWKCFS